MSDLLACQPNISEPLFLVAPEERPAQGATVSQLHSLVKYEAKEPAPAAMTVTM
jgi:hypothetical protein